MTKKDFKLFAELFADIDIKCVGFKNPCVLARIIEQKITEILAHDNPRFDWGKWEAYKEKIKAKNDL